LAGLHPKVGTVFSDITNVTSFKQWELPSESNNKYYEDGWRSQCEGFVWQKDLSTSEYLSCPKKERKWARSLRKQKRYSPGISARDLKLFTKAIGFKSRAEGMHSYICQLLDWLIDTRRVHKASTTPRGSKFLQYQIMNAEEVDRNDILDQVIERLVTVCNDNYGNYVVQCFFMLNSSEIEKKIMLRMKDNICTIAMNQYGCRVIQKAILSIKDELFHTVISVIAPNTHMLAEHMFGCHVLQRAIERGNGGTVKVMLENIVRGQTKLIVELAKNTFGCRIVQRMLEKAFPEDRETLVREITESPWNMLTLTMDEFGNYVVQYIVEQFGKRYSKVVMDVLDGRLLMMAKNKFSSNVLEILYKRGGREVQERLIEKVDIHFIKECLNNRFANYLIQTMLMEGNHENREKIRVLLQNTPDLKDLKYGKFVIYRLSRLNRSSSKEEMRYPRVVE